MISCLYFIGVHILFPLFGVPEKTLWSGEWYTWDRRGDDPLFLFYIFVLMLLLDVLGLVKAFYNYCVKPIGE